MCVIVVTLMTERTCHIIAAMIIGTYADKPYPLHIPFLTLRHSGDSSLSVQLFVGQDGLTTTSVADIAKFFKFKVDDEFVVFRRQTVLREHDPSGKFIVGPEHLQPDEEDDNIYLVIGADASEDDEPPDEPPAYNSVGDSQPPLRLVLAGCPVTPPRGMLELGPVPVSDGGTDSDLGNGEPETPSKAYNNRRHNAYKEYLLTRKVPQAYRSNAATKDKGLLGKRRRSWTSNVRHRWEMRGLDLYQKQDSYKKKSLAAEIRAECRPRKLVLTLEDAKSIVEADHVAFHDGHNRGEFRLGGSYIFPVASDGTGGLRSMVQAACRNCELCKDYTPVPNISTSTIITRHPMELVMFDLSFMPWRDPKTGFTAFLLIKDHFTKFQWGVGVKSKHMHPIANFMYDTFRVEGAPERW